MDLSVADAQRIFSAQKSLIPPLSWRDVPNRQVKSQKKQINCRVSIDGAMPRGVFFRITLQPDYPATMMYQLEVEDMTCQKRIVLYRLDTFPISAHTNPIREKSELSGLFIPTGSTHEHVFTDNLTVDGLKILTDSDKYARIVEDPPEDFLTCKDYVCDKLNIINGRDIPERQEQGSLF